MSRRSRGAVIAAIGAVALAFVAYRQRPRKYIIVKNNYYEAPSYSGDWAKDFETEQRAQG
jgi:hypothetical protein